MSAQSSGANNSAPGVYTSIIPLEVYPATVSGTNAFIAFLSDQGPDNQLFNLAASGKTFTQVFGNPNLSKYTSVYAQGSYVAYAYSSVVNSLYCLRVLPPDAQYSNVAFFIGKTTTGQLVTIQQSYNISNTSDVLQVFYQATPQSLNTNYTFEYIIPLFMVASKYRGQFYNNFQIDTTPIANVNNQFAFNIFQLYTNNQYYLASSYNASFNPNLLNNSGVSTLLDSMVDQYDSNIQLLMQDDNIVSNTNYVNGDIFANASSMFNVIQVQDTITNISQVSPSYLNGTTKFFVLNNSGNDLYGYSGQVVTITEQLQNGLPVYTVTPVSYTGSNGAVGTAGQVCTASGMATTTNIPIGTIITTSKQNVYFHIGLGQVQVFDPYTYTLMVNANPTTVALNDSINLNNGSDGSLITSTGVVNPTVASEYLQQAYQGLVDDSVLNTDNYPIDLVFDSGYPIGVKQSIVTLTSVLRQDCISLLDLGMNASASAAIQYRIQTENFNTPYAAIYDPYVQIADMFSGRNIWVSPIYVVSGLFALNDMINEQWYAVAGYSRGAVNNILSVLYQANLNLYHNNQINPIITTTAGNVIWGQLTSQYAPNALQNVNVMRLALYISRAIKSLGKYYIFDFDDTLTWGALNTSISNFLAQVAAERGLTAYSVNISATAYQITQKQVTVAVTLTANKALEQILVPIYVQ